MKKIKLGTTIMIANLIFWACYNTYFGWNKEPINDLEKQFDDLYRVVMYFAWAIYFLPLLGVYTDFIKRHEESKKD
tara:strand:- start:444 stop:671 length:228 start_codon:yes stop_codon:yes gene_type:complete